MLTNKTLKYLSEKQEILDNEIIKTKNLIIDEENVQKRIIAFFVELGEFINEERSFKYWSNKAPSAKNIQLEEYIDGVHFLISLGNGVKYDFENHEASSKMESITLSYLNVINSLSGFIINRNKETYKNLLNSFLAIADVLGFNEEELINSYEEKNKVNFQRQANNY